MTVVFQASDVTTLAGESGSHAFMYRGVGVDVLRDAFQRDSIAAKIHHMPLRNGEALGEYVWGYHYLPKGEQTPLMEALAIQNVYAALGMAPRVYGVALWRDQYGQQRPVQVTDDLGRVDWGVSPTDAYALYDRMCEVASEYGFIVPGRDSGVHNYIDGQWVDFNGFKFADDYHKRLMQRYWQGTRWGDRPYQQVLDGSDRDTCRDIRTRIEDLGLDALDFRPRHVLDIGCSGGQFLNFLTGRYGARGTGYDRPNAIAAAREYSATAGAWNIDYYSADLQQPDAITGQYDLVLFLSMSRHVGLPEYIKACAGKRLIIEIHEEHREQVKPWLASEFDIVREHISVDYSRLVVHAERKA